MLAAIERDASEHEPQESGGMLIGYWSPAGDGVITDVVEGGPAAIREPHRFVPDGHWQQERLDEIYIRSGRLHTYLGDWHSHPEGVLAPSRRDRRTAKTVAKTREARTPRPMTVIGTRAGDEDWCWASFRYRRRGFEKLAIQAYQRVRLPETSEVR